MPNDPDLVPRNALAGKRVAISVSDSEDLARLGLSSAHLELAVAELTRAIVFAGGIVVYGGGLGWGFTTIVLDEAARYGSPGGAFEHFLPYSEHAEVAIEELQAYSNELGVQARLLLIDAAGVARSVAQARTPDFARYEVDGMTALSTMRFVTSELSDARVILGGRVSDFAGEMPGVAEEAAASLTLGKPLYVCGGFGGAATLVGQLVQPDLYAWLPGDLPAGLDGEVRATVARTLPAQPSDDGLSPEERALLAQSHRPSEVATLAILGLSRVGA